jgi:hypothetical protein
MTVTTSAKTSTKSPRPNATEVLLSLAPHPCRSGKNATCSMRRREQLATGLAYLCDLYAATKAATSSGEGWTPPDAERVTSGVGVDLVPFLAGEVGCRPCVAQPGPRKHGRSEVSRGRGRWCPAHMTVR